jgi:alpha-L-fucosidase 2
MKDTNKNQFIKITILLSLNIMKLPRLLLALLFTPALVFTPAIVFAQSSATYNLHYDKPASEWTEALPVGNGRLGAMVFGKINEELIQLNEATLWSGGPVAKKVNPKAYDFLAPTRAALTQGDYQKASDLVKNMQGYYTESYLPLADLHLSQKLTATATDYSRDLNIRDGITSTRFKINDVSYTREVFASAPSQIIVVRISADKPNQVSLIASTSSPLKFSNSSTENNLLLNGQAPTHVDPSYFNSNKEPVIYDEKDTCKGMRFELAVKPLVKDGKLETANNKITVTDATEVVLLLSAATSFNGFDKCPNSQGKNEHKLAQDYLEKSARKNYSQLLNEHLADFHHYFDRVSLILNTDSASKINLPTDQRLADYTKGKSDPELEALYFQFGRYLLISSSRTPNAPANLQGIWNKEVRPPWSSNYTTNINVQMNYWAVETANLSEFFSPLNDLIHNISITGKETAASYYHAPGWVLHHNSDIWATSNPVGDIGKGDPMWANWYMGGNWLSRHLWEHYEFTGDKKFLQQSYPTMKGAAEFTLSWLQKNSDGLLVTMPSTSPENVYFYDDKENGDNKKQGNVTVAATMDMGIVRDLFTNLIAASEALNTDKAFREKLITTKQQLFPFQIGSKGQLQEWYKDFEDVDPYHRHTSHLYALHPAHEISPLTTPELAQAAKKTLELRGDDGTGWSLAWKVNMWARLLDGDHAYTLFRNLLRLTKDNNTEYGGHGGAYPNLFDAHPPFQIDGNFAGTAGVIEMLLQSQNNEIHLLPALPSAWQSGQVKGLVARGNFVVDIDWKKGKLTNANILARSGGVCTVRSNEPIALKALGLQGERSTLGYTLKFIAEKGKSYKLEANSILDL